PNKDRSGRIYIRNPFLFKGMRGETRGWTPGGAGETPGCVRSYRMKRLKSFLIALFSPVLALIFSASGLRDGVIRQNRAIMQGPRRRFTHFPRFYRLRLGFHLARALLTLVLPGDLPAARLHP